MCSSDLPADVVVKSMRLALVANSAFLETTLPKKEPANRVLYWNFHQLLERVNAIYAVQVLK